MPPTASGTIVASSATARMYAAFFRAGRRVIATPINPTSSASPQPSAENRDRSASVTTNSGSTPRLRKISTRSVSSATEAR